LGPGLLLASLNVKYRDFRYVIPFIVQFGLYVSPVGFSTAVVREKLGETLFLLYSLNPMVGVIDGFRWAILGDEAVVYWPGLAISLVMTALLLWLGITRFRRTEKTFADVI
jgi:lipopolysaccharide transport system permease protein